MVPGRKHGVKEENIEQRKHMCPQCPGSHNMFHNAQAHTARSLYWRPVILEFDHIFHIFFTF